jgi:hypothetical protein
VALNSKVFKDSLDAGFRVKDFFIALLVVFLKLARFILHYAVLETWPLRIACCWPVRDY